MCGGPRIRGAHGGEAALAALKEEQKLRADARLASMATVVQAVFAALATLVGLALLPASIVGKAIVLAIALTPMLLALRSRSRAKRARERAVAAHERALQAAAEDVARTSKRGVTTAELAKELGVEAEQAERLLTALAVRDRTRIDVGDDAQVRYSVAPEAAPVRVADDALEEQFAALEQAEAEKARGRAPR